MDEKKEPFDAYYKGDKVKAVEVSVNAFGKKRLELTLLNGDTIRVIESELDVPTWSEPEAPDIDEESLSFLENNNQPTPSDPYLGSSGTAMKEFVKDGHPKPRFSLLPMMALTEVMHVMCYGADKYAEHNYSKGQKNTTYTDAAIRHIMAYNTNQNIDTESNRHHLAHAIACLMMGLDNELVGVSIDGRNPIYKPTN